ncbi:hypothetical protein BJX63DRAFT_411245 [Aspergillus granulosus]|uniref:Uncharacterized protein n=1 Tax=Aspergillus granulosus TaxID=176169 RepID=A0ABR4GXQ3_9EURO
MSIPIVVMASILFASFEYLRRHSRTAATHIANGIEILQNWQQNHQYGQQGQWGRLCSPYVSYFRKTELGPIHTLFNLNASEFGPLPRSRLLHQVDDGGFVNWTN